MRRFACHYLYVSADGCYSKYVVELEDSGRVRAYFPLKEELSATQWIGGVIIITTRTRMAVFRCRMRTTMPRMRTRASVLVWPSAAGSLRRRAPWRLKR